MRLLDLPATHPLWRTIHAVAVTAAAGAVLLLTASTPDITEVRSTLMIGAAALAREVFGHRT